MKIARRIRWLCALAVASGMVVGLWPAGSAQASTQLAQRENGGAGGVGMPGKRAAEQSPAAQSEAIAWSLIWRDEFSGTGGVDATQWLYDVGTRYPGGPANWGTGEIDTLTDSTDNIFQSGGFLNIRAIHTSTNPLVGWTSGRIETQHIGFQPPADGALAVEASIQLPNLTGSAAQGYWPAFWMLGSPYRGNYYNWPEVGEIDIMESVNGQNQWWGTFHCGYEPGGPCNETTGLTGTALGFSPSLQAAFHTYRMEFDKSVSPQEIRWYVDGVQYHVVTADDVDAQTWADATDHGFFILLNVAIGGIWPGPPGTLTASGGTMRVDYVRVYQWPVHATYLPMLRE